MLEVLDKCNKLLSIKIDEVINMAKSYEEVIREVNHMKK